MRAKGSAETIANALGTARVEIGQPNIGWHWRIERMVAHGLGSVIVYVGGEDYTSEVDLSSSGHNVADEASPIEVFEGEPIVAVFSGAPPGTRCAISWQASIVPS